MKKAKEVNEFFDQSDNPLKAEMQMVRDIILNTDDRMGECIKWSAPTFTYKGNMATFNPRAKKFVNLTFHKGALINDDTGLLEGDKPEARVARFNDAEDVKNKKSALESVVKGWIELMDSSD